MSRAGPPTATRRRPSPSCPRSPITWFSKALWPMSSPKDGSIAIGNYRRRQPRNCGRRAPSRSIRLGRHIGLSLRDRGLNSSGVFGGRIIPLRSKWRSLVSPSTAPVFAVDETHGRVLRPGNRIIAHSPDIGWRSLYAAILEEAPFHATETAILHPSLIYHLTRPTEVM